MCFLVCKTVEVRDLACQVSTVSPAQFYIDFAHTDDALRNVLSTVKAFTAGKLWVVFGAARSDAAWLIMQSAPER